MILTTLIAILLILTVCPAKAEENKRIPYLANGVIDTTDVEALGLTMLSDTRTVTIFSPSDSTHHYANGVVMTAFKGRLYCMWQSSQTDEDAPETCVMLQSKPRRRPHLDETRLAGRCLRQLLFHFRRLACHCRHAHSLPQLLASGYATRRRLHLLYI